MLHPPGAWMNFKKLLNAWKLGMQFCQYFMMWIPPMFETKWGLFQKPSTSTKKTSEKTWQRCNTGELLYIAGWTSKDRYETELIKEIVEAVWNKVYPRFTWLCQTETLIGIDMTLKQLNLLLDTEANDVRFIGIWWMGGMGKTTIARLVYERISHNCGVSSFLANVREVCATHGLPHLQKLLLSTAYKEKFTEVWDEQQ